MRRISCAAPLRRSGLLSPLTPDGTSFNTQNPIPHPSQKAKVLLETRRAKECQRGIAGAAERAKEGGRVPSESSDTRLGPRGRRFESCHLDHPPTPGKWRSRAILRGLFFCCFWVLVFIWSLWGKKSGLSSGWKAPFFMLCPWPDGTSRALRLAPQKLTFAVSLPPAFEMSRCTITPFSEEYHRAPGQLPLPRS